MKIKFEILKSAPVEAIVSLYKEAGWWKESPEARAAISGMIKGSFCFMAAISETGEFEAMGRVISDGKSDAYIQDVVVRKNLRGQGIGRELVERLKQYCVDNKIEWIGLIAEPGTTKFYESMGFKELKKHVPMRLLQ